MMIYILKKDTYSFAGRYDNMKFAKEMLAKQHIDEDDCIFTEEIGMRYVSRIATVDGTMVYMNKEFWTKEAPEIAKYYVNHTVYDVFDISKPEGERTPVSLDRFKREMNQNIDMINAMDGTAGEIEYNMDVGMQIIALLRKECIDTVLNSVTPNMILYKTRDIVLALVSGSFREAKGLVEAMERDEFFTEERIRKYADMLASADAITYLGQ